MSLHAREPYIISAIGNTGMSLSSRVNVVRPILGFLLTPAVAPITAIMIAFVVTKAHRGDCLYGWVVGLTILFGVAASYISAAVFGVPYILIMHRIGRLSFWTIMVGALGQWVVLFTVFFAAGFCRTGYLEFAGVLAELAILYLPGMLLGGAAFYRIAVR
jgi:hypothetical protein